VPGENKLCGTVTSLSPFAIVTPIDTTPPVPGGLPPSPLVAYATSTAGATVTYPTPTAVDAVDGPRPVTCAPPSGSVFPAGKTTVTCTTSDRAGNVATASFTVWVQLRAPADGTFFLPPINADGSSIFKQGSTVPVKFKLTGASAGIANLTARLSVTKVSSGITGTDLEATSNGAANDGNLFRWDAGAGQYVFNLTTKPLTAGTWSLAADLGDGVVHKVNVSLRK
jgi:hypothetical protein